MEKGNPYEKMLEEITALLQMIESNKNMPVDDSHLPPDIMERVKKLERDVKAFEEAGKKVINLSWKSPKSLNTSSLRQQLAMESPRSRKRSSKKLMNLYKERKRCKGK